MSVYRRKSGRRAVLVDVGRGVDQKRKRRTQGTYATRKEAERAERRALDTRDRGIDLDPKKVSLGDVAERFLKTSCPISPRSPLRGTKSIGECTSPPPLVGFRSRV